MGVVSKALQEFREARPAAPRRAVNYRRRECLRYAAHAGFFQSFGMGYGQNVGAVSSTLSFIPLKVVRTDDVRESAFDEGVHHGQYLQDEAENLAAVLVQSRSTEAERTLAYALREIVRNVIEHSGSESYSFAAQYWPASGEAEIVVSDSGIGLRRSLLRNPRLEVTDDEIALDLATSAGVTSVGSRRSRMDGGWGNSGFGLYMTRRLCELGGRFAIASGKGALVSDAGGSRRLLTDTGGTTVILKLATGRLGDLDERLLEFRNAASAQGRPSKASMSSRVDDPQRKRV